MQVGALGVLQGVFLLDGERGHASGRTGQMARGAGVCRSSGLGEGAGIRQAGLVLPAAGLAWCCLLSSWPDGMKGEGPMGLDRFNWPLGLIKITKIK